MEYDDFRRDYSDYDEDLLSGSGMDIDKDAGPTPMKIEPDGNQDAALVAPPVAGSPTNNDERDNDSNNARVSACVLLVTLMKHEVDGNDVLVPSALSGSGSTDAPVSGGSVVSPMKWEPERLQQPALAAPPGALAPVSPPGSHAAFVGPPGEQPEWLQTYLDVISRQVVDIVTTCVETKICPKVGDTVKECFSKGAREPSESSVSHWPSEGSARKVRTKAAGGAGTLCRTP